LKQILVLPVSLLNKRNETQLLVQDKQIPVQDTVQDNFPKTPVNKGKVQDKQDKSDVNDG
jgi:hypothetical protein